MPEFGKGDGPRGECRWPSTRDFELEGGRYSLLGYAKAGGNGVAKVPENGRERR
jgi:hypothetical protein